MKTVSGVNISTFFKPGACPQPAEWVCAWFTEIVFQKV